MTAPFITVSLRISRRTLSVQPAEIDAGHDDGLQISSSAEQNHGVFLQVCCWIRVRGNFDLQRVTNQPSQDDDQHKKKTCKRSLSGIERSLTRHAGSYPPSPAPLWKRPEPPSSSIIRLVRNNQKLLTHACDYYVVESFNLTFDLYTLFFLQEVPSGIRCFPRPWKLWNLKTCLAGWFTSWPSLL